MSRALGYSHVDGSVSCNDFWQMSDSSTGRGTGHTLLNLNPGTHSDAPGGGVCTPFLGMKTEARKLRNHPHDSTHVVQFSKANSFFFFFFKVFWSFFDVDYL